MGTRHRQKAQTLLVGDLGGTKLLLGLFRLHKGKLCLLHVVETKWVGCRDADQLMAKALEKLRRIDKDSRLAEVSLACIAAAGRSEDGVVRLAKYPGGMFDLGGALKRQGIKVTVLLPNDFAVLQRAAASLLHVGKKKLILPGKPNPEEATLVIGAGTGCGIGSYRTVRTPYGPMLVFSSSEGGNSPIPIDHIFEPKGKRKGRDTEALRFWRWVQKNRLEANDKGQLRAEVVTSGRGLVLCWEFYKGERGLSPQEVAKRMKKGERRKALGIYAGLYGRLARTAVLWCHAQGGVYVAGGVAQKNPFILEHPAFKREFRRFGVHRGTYGDVPVHLLLKKRLNLWGSALFAQEYLERN